MQKNNIRMVAQLPLESASEFAKRLELICYNLSEEHKTITPPIIIPTSASDGRQTVTIQFMTTEINKKQPTFNDFHLRKAYEKFVQKGNNTNSETNELIQFLLKEVIGDYI